MFKRSFASLGENIKYLGVIALIFFPLVLLSYLSDIFGVYWGMDDAIKGVKEVLGSQDLTALNTYTASAYQSLSFNQGFDTAYANFSSMTWAKGFYEGLKNLLTTSYPSASQAAENAINQAAVKTFWFQLFATANFYGTCALAYYIPLAVVWHKKVKRKFWTSCLTFAFDILIIGGSVAGIRKLATLWNWTWLLSMPLISFLSIFLHLIEAWFIEGRPNQIAFKAVVNPSSVALGGLFELVILAIIVVTIGALSQNGSTNIAYALGLPLIFYCFICSAVKCDNYVMAMLTPEQREQKY
jgi:hypothetical protein